MRFLRNRRWWPALIFAGLTACSPHIEYSKNDWSKHLGNETLTFLAGAKCDSPFGYPLTTDFFAVVRIETVAGVPNHFNVDYVKANGSVGVTGAVKVVQWWAKKQNLDPKDNVDGEVDLGRITSAPCATLVELPMSADGRRPYYYFASKNAKSKEFDRLVRLLILMSGLTVLVSIAAACIAIGRGVYGKTWIILLGFGGLVVFLNFVVWSLAVWLPWYMVGQTLEYFALYDSLRQINGWHLPIGQSDLFYLLKGPPSPSETEFHGDIYFFASVALILVFTALALPSIVRGFYCWMTPLPLKEAFKHAQNEGRELTADEIAEATRQAVDGKSAWELKIMKAKAEQFTQEFGVPLSPG